MVFKEEKAIIMALQKLGDWKDKKVILSAVGFGMKEKKFVDKAVDDTYKQLDAVNWVITHMANNGVNSKTRGSGPIFKELVLLKDELVSANNSLKNVQKILP